MRKIHAQRLLVLASVLGTGWFLGSTFAVAAPNHAPTIDVTVYDELIEVDGKIIVEGDRGFVEFTRPGDRQATKVEVRGWDPRSKKGLLHEGDDVRVNGASSQGKKVEYRGHVTVLK